MANEISVDTLVSVYIKIRNARAANTREYEAKDKELSAQLKQVEQELTRRAQAEGVEGFKTEHGTTYLDTSVKASIRDDTAFFAWIKQHDAFDFLERRVKGSEVKKYIENHEGALPPGIDVFKEITTKVRSK